MALPVAIQLYSLRADAGKDFRGTLEAVKQMGYDGVEFAGLFGNAPADVKAMCEEIGLNPISAHVPLADLIAAPEKVLADYKTVGCEYVVVPYLDAKYRENKEVFEGAIAQIASIGEAAEKVGLQLLYHNHDFEFVKYDGKYMLDLLYETVPAKFLATELDTCWVNVGGEEPAAYVRKYTGRAPVVHLKDFFGEKSDDMYELIGIKPTAPKRPSGFEFRPLGSGLQNIPEILAALVDAGAKWVVVEQDNPSMGLTPMECAKKSREYLKTLGY